MPSQHRRASILAFLVAFAAISLLVLAACSSDDDEDRGQAGKGNSTERAFLEAMVPHHESAIEMADVADHRAESTVIKRIAKAIGDAQGPEIEQMKRIHQRLFGAPLEPNEGAHEQLGLTAEEAGMGQMGAVEKLEKADLFDRAFVDEMVPHHRGAVSMARVALDATKDRELRSLAEAIISTQEREIKEMNDFRAKEYGSPVPAGEGGAVGRGENREQDGGHEGGH